MKFKIGDIVNHKLSKEKFIIIEIKDIPVFTEYICRHPKNRE